jgi:Arc/MetJ-type ribon-helix-helix transcriptional regulator
VDDTQQPSNTTTPTTTIDPGSSDATTFTKKTMAPRLPTSFQVKQMNEAAIDRLFKSGMFLSKAYVVQAALTALFEKLIEQSRATTRASASPVPEGAHKELEVAPQPLELGPIHPQVLSNAIADDVLPTAPPRSPEQEEAAQRLIGQ